MGQLIELTPQEPGGAIARPNVAVVWQPARERFAAIIDGRTVEFTEAEAWALADGFVAGLNDLITARMIAREGRRR